MLLSLRNHLSRRGTTPQNLIDGLLKDPHSMDPTRELFHEIDIALDIELCDEFEASVDEHHRARPASSE